MNLPIISLRKITCGTLSMFDMENQGLEGCWLGASRKSQQGSRHPNDLKGGSLSRQTRVLHEANIYKILTPRYYR